MPAPRPSSSFCGVAACFDRCAALHPATVLLWLLACRVLAHDAHCCGCGFGTQFTPSSCLRHRTVAHAASCAS
jgi:hypothetical protein